MKPPVAPKGTIDSMLDRNSFHEFKLLLYYKNKEKNPFYDISKRKLAPVNKSQTHSIKSYSKM